MKIAIIGASGRAGNFIMKEALSRGHDITAIVRDKNKITEKNIKIIEKVILELEYDDVKDNEVIIDAFGVWQPEKLSLHVETLKYLANLLSDKPNRLLVVGGAGSLYVDSEHTMELKDNKDFPEDFMPLATNMGLALDELRKYDNVNWTYISPAADFQADGERVGKYILAGEELTTNSKGESVISYADYAIAMVDEAENGTHIKERISVVGDY